MRFKLFAVLVLLIAVPALMFAQEAQQEEQPADQPQVEQPADQPAEEPALEAEEEAPEEAMPEAAMAEEGMNVRMSQVAGIMLANEAGDVQGQVVDFVVVPSGEITHAVVQFSEPQDAAEQYLVPAEQINVAASGMDATLDLSADEIAGLQTLQDGELSEDLGVAEGAAAADMQFLAGNLQGITVMGSDGQELGTVEDAMMNLQEKKIEYIALAPSGVLGLGDQLFAVPVDAAVNAITDIDVEQGTVSVGVSADELRQMEGFSQDAWPETAPQM